MNKETGTELSRRMPVMQSDMFGQSKPVFEDCPPVFYEVARKIYWLWDEGRDQDIADDENHMQLQYWITYEGLGKVLGEDALMRFAEWYKTKQNTSSETLSRARRILTTDASGYPPYMPQSPEAKRRRKAKQGMIESQIRRDRQRYA